MLGEVKRETQSSHMLEQRRPLVMPAGKTQRMLWAAGALVIPTDARPGAAVAHAIAGGAAPSTDSVRRPRHRRAGAGPGPAGCFPAPAAVELGWRDHSTHALGPFAATLLAPRAATALPRRRAVPSAAAVAAPADPPNPG